MIIREVQISDADSIASLSGELGYPVAAGVMSDRIRYTQDQQNHVAFVAVMDEAVVGWIDIAMSHHLQSGPYVEIGGLVVSGKERNKGIGRRLVAAAEEWAAQQGVADILVRSQIMREAAHRFYLREEYAQIKISAVFRKTLAINSK